VTLGQLWRLSRPPTLPASIVPVTVGTAAGALAGRIAWPLAADMAVVAILLQAATNMTNEYHDYTRGVDERESVGIAGVLVGGEMAADEVRAAFLTTFLVATVLGLILAFVRGPLLLALGFLSIAVAYLYNAGPRPISATPFGEATVFVVMGPLEVLVSEIAAVGHGSAAGVAASVPVAALVAAILLANNLRDHDSDRRHGRRTLPIVLGPAAGRRLFTVLVGIALAAPVVGWLIGLLPVEVVLVLLAGPAALALVRGVTAPAADLRAAVGRTARLELLTGGLLAVGLVLSLALPGR
jgi:1,4-dihydroxy-2-naphthoate polyprenyltransferase